MACRNVASVMCIYYQAPSTGPAGEATAARGVGAPIAAWDGKGLTKLINMSAPQFCMDRDLLTEQGGARKAVLSFQKT